MPIQLIGQFDSPFVRRVGIALKRYAMEFEHVPLSTFGDSVGCQLWCSKVARRWSKAGRSWITSTRHTDGIGP
jgi:hypothetical protein